MRALVIGAKGQLGRHLCRQLGEAAIAVSRTQLDFRDAHMAMHAANLLKQHKPDYVFNAAAFTDVTAAEKGDADVLRLNAEAPGILAEVCAEHRVGFLHASTDYVFAGEKQAAYLESDNARPLNGYGASKLAGELAVQRANPQAIIARFAWLYDAAGTNFFTLMHGFARTQNMLRIVADQISTPTYAADAARMATALVHKGARGTYHCVPDGHSSWHGFACAILPKFHPIHPILGEEYAPLLKRPCNSRLDNRKLKALGVATRHWREGLAECTEHYHAHA